MDKNKTVSILLIIAIFFITAGVSYAIFAGLGLGKKFIKSSPPKSSQELSKAAFDDTLPKTEACPLNGVKYSKPRRDWWETHRPLGVMIENHQESRPQSGLSFADVVYEGVAEGGITRFLVIFYCQDADPIGPVRSARTYFVDMVSQYGNNPLYAHVGGANTPGPADALGQISDYGWTGYNDLNQFSIGFPTFWRDYDRMGHEVATEHTMYSATSKLWEYAKTDRKITINDEDGKRWSSNFTFSTFKDDPSISDRKGPQTVHLEFWEDYGDYFVDWTYNKETNAYTRTNGGKSHSDKNTGKPLSAKNIIVLSMKESNANDGYEDNAHLLYDTEGTGKATIFMDGKRINGSWEKESRTDQLIVNDDKGKPVVLNRGLTWFVILPTTGVMTVK